MNNSFFHFLEQRLKKPLPGKEAQQKMMPEPVDPSKKIPVESIDSSGHPSGVLVPLFPDANEDLNVILTLRTDLIRHAGQISFPGGRCDKHESTIETALRETQEEIGVSESQIKVAGMLTPFYLYRSHNQITPVVGYLNQEPEMLRNPTEVEEIITIKLDTLLSDEILRRERWNLAHNSFNVPFWDFHQVPLWGATAMILSELLEIYAEYLERNKR